MTHGSAERTEYIAVGPDSTMRTIGVSLLPDITDAAIVVFSEQRSPHSPSIPFLTEVVQTSVDAGIRREDIYRAEALDIIVGNLKKSQMRTRPENRTVFLAHHSSETQLKKFF